VKLLIARVDFSFFYLNFHVTLIEVCVFQIHCSQMLLNKIYIVTLHNFKADHVHNTSPIMSISDCVNIAACAVSVFDGVLENFEI